MVKKFALDIAPATYQTGVTATRQVGILGLYSTMSENVAAPVSAAPAQGQSGAVEHSGNVSVSQLSAELLKRASPAPAATPGAEPIAAPAPAVNTATGTPPAPAGEASPPAADAPAAEEATPKGTEPPAADADDVLSTESGPLDPKLQAKIDRKIAKEVAKREALRIENEALKEQLKQQTARLPEQQAKLPEIKPTPDAPLAHVQDPQALATEAQNAKEVMRWAEAQLDRDDIGSGVQLGDRTYTKADLRAIARNARVVLEDHVPARNAFLQQRQAAIAEAVETYPWIKDQNSPEFMRARAIAQRYPGLINVANSALIIGVQVEGEMAVEARKKAKASPPPATPASKPVPAASQTATGASPGAVRVPQGTQAQQKLAEKVAQMKAKGNVSRSDVAKLLQERERALQTR